MTLKILEISTLERMLVGRLKLTGENGMKLRKVEINSPYNEKLTNMELLTPGTDYSGLGYENYLLRLKSSISERLNKEVTVREKKLNPQIEKLLIQYYAQR